MTHKWMAVADAIAAMSRCDLRKVGAVVLDKQNRVVSTGYNGAPAGYVPDTGETCSHWCPRAQKREQGAEYDNCCSIHAELNSLLFADRSQCTGGTLIVTSAPCMGCAKAIANSGIARVIARVDWINDAHRKPDLAIKLLLESGLTVDVEDVTA